MQISSNSILNSNIVDAETGKSFAVVNKMVFDANGRKLFALEVSPNTLWPTKRYLAWLDINYDNNFLSAGNDNILSVDDFPKIAHIIKQKTPILGQKVFNQLDQFLGSASDVMVDSVTGQILQIECKHLLDKRLFSIDDVISIDSRGVKVDIGNNTIRTAEYEAIVE